MLKMPTFKFDYVRNHPFITFVVGAVGFASGFIGLMDFINREDAYLGYEYYEPEGFIEYEYELGEEGQRIVMKDTSFDFDSSGEVFFIKIQANFVNFPEFSLTFLRPDIEDNGYGADTYFFEVPGPWENENNIYTNSFLRYRYCPRQENAILTGFFYVTYEVCHQGDCVYSVKVADPDVTRAEATYKQYSEYNGFTGCH
ncbi:TPA: hypothetical protein ACVO12_004753 [Vibrio diabolicus]